MKVLGETYKILKRNRTQIIISASVLVAGMVLAIVLNVFSSEGQFNKEPPVSLKLSVIDYIKNNVYASLLLLTGLFTLGLTTAFFMFINGVIISDSIYVALKNNKDILHIIMSVLPHGIFEIPAIIICGALGFKSLVFCIRIMRGYKVSILSEIIDIGVLYVIAVLLLCIAGMVEGKLLPFITK